MKTALVIPTLNAVKRGFWYDLLRSVAEQTLHLDLKLVVDSESNDQTAELAAARGWKCLRIRRGNFNHGDTRRRIVRYLHHKGFDTVVFLSQDAVLSEPGALDKLTKFLWNNPVAGCYGKQISLHEHTLNAWQRERCYPDASRIKTQADIARDGLMASFCSNAFSAWKIPELIRLGNFPRTNFGEDMLMAASVLEQGGAIGYCCDAIVIHEHSNAPVELLKRGWQIGRFHYEHPELLRKFTRTSARIAGRRLTPSVILPLAIKASGYFAARFRDRILPWCVFLLIWLLLLPALILEDYPQPDLSGRYAPMAEAFARGDWTFAFHPRVTPLLPVCAGVFAKLFSCGGFLACQLAASLLLSLCVFPLYSACRRLYGGKIGIWTCFLFAGCPYILRLGYYGMRESGSMLGILLCGYATVLIVQAGSKFKGWFWFAVGEAVLLLSRGDMTLFAALMGAAIFVRDCVKNRLPVRSVLTGFLVLFLILPQLLYCRHMIGYPVLEVRHAAVMRSVLNHAPALAFLASPDPVMPLDIGIPGAGVNAPESRASFSPPPPAPAESAPFVRVDDDLLFSSHSAKYDTTKDFLVGVWKGLFPRLLPFFLLGIVFRIGKRKWTRADTVLLTLFVVFDLLAAFQVPLFYRRLVTSPRYLLIGAVLYFPFAALGMNDTWRVLRQWFLGRLLAATLFFLLVVSSLYDLYSPLIIEYAEDAKKGIERRISMAAADWIRADWALTVSDGDEALVRPLSYLKCDQYQSGRRPLVLSGRWNRIGWLAGGQVHPDFLRDAGIMPDYIVTRDPADLPSMRLVYADTILDTDYYIYKSSVLCTAR